MRYFLSLLSLSCLFALPSCGGGGSSSDSAPANPLQTGVFVDSPVMGLRYATASQSGLTNTSGEYQYLSGETVTFSLGGIILGSATAGSLVTPLNLIGATSFDDAKERGLTDHLTNLLVFLQSLDRDHNPDNGIDLTDLDEALANEELEFDTISSLFLKSAYKRIVNEQNGFYQDIKHAQNDFLTSLSATVSVRVPIQDDVDRDGDGETDRIIRYSYDNSGNVIEAIESTVAGTQLNRSTMNYDPYGQLTEVIFEELDPQALIFTRRYEYDSFGRITNELDEDENFADNIARSVITEYDDVGNITRRLLEQKHTDVNFNPHLSTFDTFFIFSAYNPNWSGTVGFPAPLSDNTGRSPGGENILYETIFTYDDMSRITEKDEHYEYQKSGSETGPWAFVSTLTSYRQGNPSDYSTQIILGEPYNGTGSITAEYNLSEAGNVTGCNVTTTGIIGEVTSGHNFEDSETVDIYCSSGLARQTEKNLDEQSQIIGVEVSEWGPTAPLAPSDTIESSPPSDNRSRAETQEFDYNENGLVTEARQTIIQQSFGYSTIISTTGTHRIEYNYSATGELQSLHSYINDELRYSQTRSFQTLELEQLP